MSDLDPPRISLGLQRRDLGLQILDASMKLAGIDGGFDEEVLRLGELSAQFGVLGGYGGPVAKANVPSFMDR